MEKFGRATMIVFGCVGIAIAFGILHDLFSSSVCVEYFTVHHPKVVESEHWLVMALVWGVLATWWVGLGGGFWLAWCSQFGRLEPLPVRIVLARVTISALVVLLVSPLVWAVAYWLGSSRLHAIDPSSRATDLDARLVASATMHAVSYGIAGIAFFVMGFMAVRVRYQRATKA